MRTGLTPAWWRALLLCGLLAPATTLRAADGAPAAGPSCGAAGQWLAPADRSLIADPTSTITPGSVVLLGEEHDSAEDHRWQLHVLAELYGRYPGMVLGFEMFPRRAQPVLDRWVAGEIDADEFIAATDWKRFWGFDPNLYLPIFDFARMHRVPMVALNVSNQLASRVSANGFAAIPEDQREGISAPAPATPLYRAELERIGRQHGTAANIEHFIDAQLLWDRAFAEGLAAAHGRLGTPLVIGVMGGGHVSRGSGVPHQLEAMGVAPVVSYLTWDSADSCTEIVPDLADALFVVSPPTAKPQPPPLRLGVRLDQVGSAVRVVGVVAGSVGEAAGLQSGDILMTAAGKPLATPDDLVATVGRLSPGTWLPLTAQRGGETLDLVAKFAPSP